jgi:hypothetical protein
LLHQARFAALMRDKDRHAYVERRRPMPDPQVEKSPHLFTLYLLHKGLFVSVRDHMKESMRSRNHIGLDHNFFIVLRFFLVQADRWLLEL